MAHAQASNNMLIPKDLSLYVHVPFCHSLCYFCGCNKVITQPGNEKVARYLESLYTEISQRAQLFNSNRLVSQIHFGGGTPNFLSTDQIFDILSQIAIQFHLELPKNLEISIELDPREISADELSQLAAMGVNRFSIGIQDFTPEVQQAVNRVQDETQTLELIRTAMQLSDSVNVDLITGLPKQSLESFADTLDKVIELGVTRIATYQFAYLPARIKAQRMLDASALPDNQLRQSLAELARQRLLAAGYIHIGMDHYALPEDSLSKALQNNTLHRNFQGYTTQKDTDLIGFGASAISKLDSAFAQNHTQLSDYSRALMEDSLPIAKGIALSQDDQIRSEVIQQIMCRSEVNLEQTLDRFLNNASALTLREYLRDDLTRLKPFYQDGLLEQSNEGFRLTDQGRYFMRPIAAVFDRYYTNSPTSDVNQVLPFSRAV